MRWSRSPKPQPVATVAVLTSSSSFPQKEKYERSSKAALAFFPGQEQI
jgi:hypothetical protein